MKNKVKAILKKWSKFQVGDTTEMDEARKGGNMNDDNFEDHRALNLSVNEYLLVEVVAVPETFQIENHLKMREAAGIFENEKISLKQLAIIAEGVKASPIFSLLNNPLIEPQTCMYFLNIMAELNLVIRSVDNPIKRNREEYAVFLKNWRDQRFNYVRGQDVKRMNFIVINLVPMYQQHVMDEAIDAVNSISKFSEDVKKMKEDL